MGSREETAETGGPKRPKGYSRPYEVMLSIQSGGKKNEMRGI